MPRTDQKMAAFRAFMQAHARTTEAIDGELRDARALPLTWYDVLSSLGGAPQGRLRMQDLADAVLFSRSGLTRLIDRMAQDGLVRREPCADDRRGMYTVLTARGRRELGRAHPVHLRGVQRYFWRHLNDGDIRALGSALNKLLRATAASDDAR